VRQVDRHGHQGGGFVAGVAEHHPLVACADGFNFGIGHLASLGFQRLVHTHGNVTRLLGNCHLHAAGVAVKALGAVIVTDIGDDLAHQFIKIHKTVGGDFAQHQHKAGLGGGFAGNARGGILLQAGIQHGIADLVAEFVGVTFGHRFGGEEEMLRFFERGVHDGFGSPF